MLRFGPAEEVPAVPWGPRGSHVSVRGTAQAPEEHPTTSAMLPANHGLPVFGPDPADAADLPTALEESAEAEIAAAAQAPGTGARGGSMATPEANEVRDESSSPTDEKAVEIDTATARGPSSRSWPRTPSAGARFTGLRDVSDDRALVPIAHEAVDTSIADRVVVAGHRSSAPGAGKQILGSRPPTAWGWDMRGTVAPGARGGGRPSVARKRPGTHRNRNARGHSRAS
ncbi:class II aldolase/adducin family protein [Embleya sp. AB8]|uniref:class II aldolase/adducin family protein n=1 Tax=Embleya sp. AB8 TaxID=3156304 RepID=UPI003C753801